jgi:hypothetical protein
MMESLRYKAILGRHGVAREDLCAEIELTARADAIGLADGVVDPQLIRQVHALQEKVAQARLEIHYLMPEDLQELQLRAWSNPALCPMFATALLAWLGTLPL